MTKIKKIEKENLVTLYNIEKEIFKNNCFSYIQIEEMFLMKNYSIYVISIKKELVGYLIIFDNSESLEIIKIGILNKERKKGLGKKLINEAKKIKKNILLEVRKSNVVAIKFYKENLFKEIGIRKNYYEKEREDALVMVFFNK